MEKIERETHDFMNVESFSQLPFIRPAPVKDQKTGIRLFGIEFGATTTADESVLSGEATTPEPPKETDSGGDSNRKFECHYCCRNFPTSQALGGHQNAHKRERQHAKRAHLHSTAASAMFHGGYRLGPAPVPPPLMASYQHSWNTSITNGGSSIYDTTPRFYGTSYGSSSSSSSSSSYISHYHHNQQQQPINGSPMGSLWRNIPTVQSSGGFNRDRSLMHHPLPLFSNDEMPSQKIIGSSGAQSVQDHVSLDLHL